MFDINIALPKPIDLHFTNSITQENPTETSRFPNFRPLRLTDFELLSQLTKEFKPMLAWNFVSLLVWGKTEISFLNGNVVLITAEIISSKKIYTLLGTKNVEESIEEIFKYQKEYNILPTLHFMPEEMLQLSINLNDYYSVVFDRGYCSYVYEVEPFLKGFVNMRTHRNLYNRFRTNYSDANFELHPLTDKLAFSKALAIFKEWQIEKNRTDDEVAFEFDAISKLHEYATLFPLYILFLVVGDKVIGFDMIDLSLKNYLVPHFGKTLRGYPGADEMMYYKEAEICRHLGYEYINTGEDLDIDGLRKHKQSYHPTFLITSFNIFPK